MPYLNGTVCAGVAFFFDVNGLGSGNVDLQQALSYGNNRHWIDIQLNKLKALYPRSRNPVFIMIALTTEEWRGYLTRTTNAQLVLVRYVAEQISNITDRGGNIVVGLSEMNSLDLQDFYQVYSILHQYLPNAELMYYTDLGQPADSIKEVFSYLKNSGIVLKYIGYDIYPHPSYSYQGGKVAVPSNRRPNYGSKSFAEMQDINFFIGEVGFRSGDVDGWQYPYSTKYINFNNSTGYISTITYYEQVINQLHSLGIDLIGIWNFDGSYGDPFGLWNNPHVANFLKFIGNRPYITATPTSTISMSQQTTTQTSANTAFRELILIVAITAVFIGLLTLRKRRFLTLY